MFKFFDIFSAKRKGFSSKLINRKVPTASTKSGKLATQQKALPSIKTIRVFDDTLEESESYRLIFGGELQHYLSMNTDMCEMLSASKEVFISFKFDWKSYESWIVITSKDCHKEVLLKTPQIPLIGGVWSNTVATRMLSGQVLVSAMLTSVTCQVNFAIRQLKATTKAIKLDKCFYAPFLYYTVDEYADLSHGELISELNPNAKVHKEYHSILQNGNPEAFKRLINLSQGESYWKTYHDKLSL